MLIYDDNFLTEEEIIEIDKNYFSPEKSWTYFPGTQSEPGYEYKFEEGNSMVDFPVKDVAYFSCFQIGNTEVMKYNHKVSPIFISLIDKFCKKHKINYLQAHSSSFFTAFLLKMTLPSIQIIWHDHNGMSEFIGSQKTRVIQFCSYFFKGIVVVNDQLKQWAESTLNCKKVLYLPNFTKLDYSIQAATKLKGTEGKRIVYLANLRFQKNHFLALDVAEKMQISHPDWSLHLIGKDFDDAYSEQVKTTIIEKQLTNTVFIYGSRQDIVNVLQQASIAKGDFPTDHTQRQSHHQGYGAVNGQGAQ